MKSVAGSLRDGRVGDEAAMGTLGETVRQRVADVQVPVVDASGLVLLKLYAGGPQDRWDIEQLLDLAADREALKALVGQRLADLPPRCRRLWMRLIEPED